MSWKVKEILEELKLDNSNSTLLWPFTLTLYIDVWLPFSEQQVLDMLRDRLTESLGELANERSHLYEVQEAYAAECQMTRQALEYVKTAGECCNFGTKREADISYRRESFGTICRVETTAERM